MKMKAGALAIILILMLGAIFFIPTVSACHTRFLYVDGVKVYQDGNNQDVNVQDHSMEPGDTKTYEIKLNQRPGCSSQYINTFSIKDRGPDWPMSLKDKDGNEVDGVEQTVAGSDVNTFVYFRVDSPANAPFGNNLFTVEADTDDSVHNDRAIIQLHFKIVLTGPNDLPTVELTAPNGGEIISGVTEIQWSANDTEDDDLDLSMDLWYRMGGNGTPWHPIASDQGNTGSYSWDTANGLHNSDDYEVRVTAKDSLGGIGEDISAGLFEIKIPYENKPPSLSIVQPVGGEDWYGERQILWYATDDLDENLQLKVDIFYSHDAGLKWNVIVQGAANAGDYTWNTSQYPDGEECFIKILCEDSNGLITGAISPGSFRVYNQGKLDSDNDGYPDNADAFPNDVLEWIDTDGDGTGNNGDTDDDNDGWNDTVEIDLGTDPLDKEDFPDDFDEDGIADVHDTDDDNDGVPDDVDAFPKDPLETVDTDGDGLGDNADTDDDDDGVKDEKDVFPLDPEEAWDADGDGIGNNADPDDDNDGWSDEDEIEYGSNPHSSKDTPEDEDGDMLADHVDDDDDNDLVCDKEDAFPNDPNEWDDTDGDGLGDNEDPDDDNDGWSDALEEKYGSQSLDPASMPPDIDGDMVVDDEDDDMDGDGIPNDEDLDPADPKVGKSNDPGDNTIGGDGDGNEGADKDPGNDPNDVSGSANSDKGSSGGRTVWYVGVGIVIILLIGLIVVLIGALKRTDQSKDEERDLERAADGEKIDRKEMFAELYGGKPGVKK